MTCHLRYDQTYCTPEICLIVIDEKSARALGQPVDEPWDRRLHTQLVRMLTQAHAKAILFDVIFDSPSSQEQVDKDFAAAIRTSGRTFLGAEMRSVPGREIAEEQVIAPIPILRQAAAGWGLLDFRPVDPDTAVRQIFAGTEQVANVTWKIARYLGASLSEKPDATTQRWINYYGPAGTMTAVGYDEALRPTDVPANFFRDRIVVVGGRQTIGTLTQKSDQHVTPYTRWGQPFTSGMEIHATILLNLVRGDWLQRLSPRAEGWLIISFGIIVTALLLAICALGPFRAVASAVLVALLLSGAACFLVWRQHIWFNWIVPVAVQTPAALFWAVGTNYVLEVRRRATIRRAFSLYLSPHMAEQIAEENFDLTPGGKLVEATMMFTILKALPPSQSKFAILVRLQKC